MNSFYEHKRRTFLRTWAKAFAVLLLIVMGLGVMFAGAGAYATWLAARDAKLMAMHDRIQESKLALHCGLQGSLVHDATTGGYACLYVNKDGQALLHAIPSAPLLASKGAR